MAKKKEKVREEIGGDRLKRKLLDDDTFQKFKAIVRGIKTKVDVPELEAEVTRLHQGRLSRNLFGTTPGPEQLLKATTQDSSFRSRMVEVRVSLVRHRDRLDVALDATRLYLATKFADQVSDIRTKGERMAYFDTYLQSGLKVYQELKSFITRLDDLIKDIDQTSYTYKTALECLELLYSRNNDRNT